MTNLFSLEGKNAWITGAAYGIGFAIAEAYVKAGAKNIVFNVRSEEACQKALDAYHAAGIHNVKGYVCDVTDEVAVKALVETIHAEVGQIDILVNNAGIAHMGLLMDMSREDWQHIMDVNLNSCFYTAKFSIPLFLQKHSGCILNISSVWGNVGAAAEVAYSTSKAGVNGFTKALAKELAPSHITVNAIACGVIDTSMNQCFSPGEIQELIDEIPADRLGKASEIAEIALQLVNTPDYMTGQIITVDGGWY